MKLEGVLVIVSRRLVHQSKHTSFSYARLKQDTNFIHKLKKNLSMLVYFTYLIDTTNILILVTNTFFVLIISDNHHSILH